MILMSACLAGIDCKYSGGNNEVKELKELYEQGKAVLVCPEVMGGLPVPRLSSEIRGNKVYNTAGEDVTANFVKGAEAALKTAREHGCTCAILKAKSPSCGTGTIYDGTFTHTTVPGDGIFAAMAKAAGIECMSETDYTERLGNTDDTL